MATKIKSAMVEGPQATKTFENAMKRAFQVSKDRIRKVEKKDKAKRDRNRT